MDYTKISRDLRRLCSVLFIKERNFLMKIAIDAMGGDHAPKEIIEGALLALKEDPSL